MYNIPFLDCNFVFMNYEFKMPCFNLCPIWFMMIGRGPTQITAKFVCQFTSSSAISTFTSTSISSSAISTSTSTTISNSAISTSTNSNWLADKEGDQYNPHYQNCFSHHHLSSSRDRIRSLQQNERIRKVRVWNWNTTCRFLIP